MRTLKAFTLCALLCSPVMAQEATDANKEKATALNKELREITKKLYTKKRALAEDPDVQAAEKAAKAKQMEAQAAREAVYAKIAEKNPEFKELLASRNALKTKIGDRQKKSEELAATIAKSQAELNELRKSGQTVGKEYQQAEKDIMTKSRPHMKDADLADLLASVKTADTAYREAQQVPDQKAQEKDPEYKELATRRAEIAKEMQALRPKKVRPAKADKPAKTDKPAREKKKKKEK